MDETNFVSVEAPALIGIGAQSIVEQSKQLGLTWTFQPGTVVTTMENMGTVQFDGDTTAVNCANITDDRILAGTRVMGIITPTGNYVISTLDRYTGPWVPMIFQNGWTNSAPPTAVSGSYRRIASNCVQLVGELTPGTTADGTTVTTLPTGYRPTADTAFPYARNPGIAGAVGPLLQLRSSGILRVYGSAGAATVWFTAIIPLDAP